MTELHSWSRAARLACACVLLPLGCGTMDEDLPAQTQTSSPSSTSDTPASSTDEADSTGAEALEPDQIAILVLEQGVGAGDLDVIETYVREDYIQHSALAADGREGLIDLIQSFGEQRPEVDIVRVFSRDNHVFLHSVYDIPGLGQQVAFDVFRFEDGLMAEHWDALQAWVPPEQSVSGRSMVDGPTEAIDLELTEANEQLVASMIDEVFIGGDLEALPEYISAETYAQHNPLADDGLEGLADLFAGLAEQGLALRYTENHILLGQGNFVLVGSEGVFGPVDAPPFAVFYDLFRVEDGLIVEHWDVVPNPPPDPTMLPHDNGLW